MNQTLTVDVPEEVAAVMESALKSGAYASENDLVAEALRSWSEFHLAPDAPDLRAICLIAAADKRPGVEPGPVFARLRQRFGLQAEPPAAE